MIFNRNQTAFPTMLHREIYMSALRLIPTEVSLAEIKEKDPELAESGRQYHAFTVALYADMYEHPEDYGMNPGAYEAYTKGRKYNAAKRYDMNKAKIAADRAGAELGCYRGILNRIGSLCTVEDGKCMLSAEEFDTLKRYTFLSKRERENAIYIDTVFAAFARNTLTFVPQSDGRVEVRCEKYPKMFDSFSRLSKAVDETVKHPLSAKLKYYFCQNAATLDFRQIFENYHPTYEDYVRFLPDEALAVITAVNKLAKEYKLKMRLWQPYMIIYEYKKKGVITVWAHDQWPIEPAGKQKEWVRCPIVVIHGSSSANYLQSVLDQGDAFLKQFQKHLNYCTCCTPPHCSPEVPRSNLFGRNVRICGEPAAVFKNPKISDLDLMHQFFKLKIKDIGHNKMKNKI